MKIQSFEELTIWQDSMELCKEVYKLSSDGRFNNDYGLKDQVRRAAVSVPSNIAEGFERDSNNELIRYLRIAKGSLGEIRTQLKLATSLGYVSPVTSRLLVNQLVTLSKQTSKLISYLEIERNKR